ncbi:hypothetical protein ACFUTR_33800 [Streptomyces sp. NPDC057367]
MFRFRTEHAGLEVRTIDLIRTLENPASRPAPSFNHSFMLLPQQS